MKLGGFYFALKKYKTYDICQYITVICAARTLIFQSTKHAKSSVYNIYIPLLVLHVRRCATVIC